MRFTGIGIGSRTIELVMADETGEIIAGFQSDTGFDPIAEAKKMIGDTEYDRIAATGYGRNLFEISFDAPPVRNVDFLK